MPVPSVSSAHSTMPRRPGDLRVMLLIARRAALESLRYRTAVAMSAFFALAVPILWVLLVIRPAAQRIPHGQQSVLGTLIAIYLMTVGLLPASAASGVASGQFAGEKEQGNLAPLLASPASNRAIFGGKVLGAVLPAILYSSFAEASYLIEIAIVAGPDKLLLLPGAPSAAMLALVLAFALFAAAVASLISSRVRTFNAAQNMTGLVLLPIMFVFFALAVKMQDWGPLALFAGVAAILAADIALVVLSAATWRREEVLAKR
jgi:ABC-type Na+ efflux pump permease subunit